jgi:hypothetical protein
VDVDISVQGDIIFTLKRKTRKPFKERLLGNPHTIDIYVPQSPKYEIQVEPSSFDINDDDPAHVTVFSKMRMTSKCTICLIIVCEEQRIYSAIEFKMESKPSMWIDIDEITMTGDFLGGGG